MHLLLQDDLVLPALRLAGHAKGHDLLAWQVSARLIFAGVLALMLYLFLALPRPTIIPAPAASSGESDPLAGGASEATGSPVDAWPAMTAPADAPTHTPTAAEEQPTSTPAVSPVGLATVSGIASFYAWHPGEAAAGPALRAFLGPKWRGTFVAVCVKRCIWVRLTDFCQCFGTRLIDLDSRSFAKLAPLSRGLVEVRVIP